MRECSNARIRECVNKHAQRTSVYTMCERSFEASEAGERRDILRWSVNSGMWEGKSERSSKMLAGFAKDSPRRGSPKVGREKYFSALVEEQS